MSAKGQARAFVFVILAIFILLPFFAVAVNRTYGLEDVAPVESQAPSEEPSPSADPTTTPAPTETETPDHPIQEEEPPQEPCTWDGRTVEEFRPGWWAQEQARFQAMLEAFAGPLGLTLEQASLEDGAPRVHLGPDVTAMDLPQWMRNLIIPNTCELIGPPTPPPTDAADTRSQDEILQDTWFERRTPAELAQWSALQESIDRAWLEAEILSRGSEPSAETWLWNPCWPPEAMPWYPSDFPPPAIWDGVRSGCR